MSSKKGKGKGKTMQDRSASETSTLGDDYIEYMTLDMFKMWTETALKLYLSVRGKITSGSFDEVAARAFIAWEDGSAVDADKEHQERKNVEEYKVKLVHGSVVLPDPITLQDGWFDESYCTQWPSIYFMDISDYLKMKTPSELYMRLCNEYKQGKAYRYFTSGWVQKIYYHPVSKNSTIGFLSTKVTPSMRLHNKAYQVWCAVEKDHGEMCGGRIISAYCTCPAGLPGSCNHVAGILFKVEHFVKSGLTKPTCTSLTSRWNVPGASGISKAHRVADMKWEKQQYFNQDRTEFTASVRSLAVDFSPMSAAQEKYVSSGERVRAELGQKLKSLAPNSCFVQLQFMKPFPKQPIIPCPPAPSKHAESIDKELDCQQVAAALLEKLARVDFTALEEATRGQSSSSDWFDQRVGRVTASNFHRVCTRHDSLEKNPNESPKRLLKDLMGYSPRVTTAATKHGQSMEPHAKAAYTKIMKKTHTRFTTRESGLRVMAGLPYLAASPDLVVCCSCHGEGLCEIKCPYSIRDATPIANSPVYLLQMGSKVALSTSHAYYTQIQGQMAVTGVKFCDFFVYTAHGHHYERILFDSEFWESKQLKLSRFWQTYIAPELVHQTLQLELDASNTPEKREVLPSTSASKPKPCSVKPLKRTRMPLCFLCGICKREVVDEPTCQEEESIECSECKVWFHLRCATISVLQSEEEEWLCNTCTSVLNKV